jgi:hypothetical protein
MKTTTDHTLERSPTMATYCLITTRARAWAGRGVCPVRCSVEMPGRVVRVWDPIARHYTSCHALSPRAERRIRRLVGSMSLRGVVSVKVG